MWQPFNPETWRTSKRADLENVKEPVSQIIERVRYGGDSALMEITRELDGVDLKDIKVTKEEMQEAYERVDPALVKALNEAYYRIFKFHTMQMPPSAWFGEAGSGIILGMKNGPLRRVGAYIPGGRASYPSTALMATVPAKVAGVPQTCCCTPPPINPVTLVALHIAGVREVYRLGGAQAIAAMAIGTETISPVQKIVGPGNIYVTAAKMLLRDHAEIDFPAGPSELVVVADHTSYASFIAADIMAQAEHDPRASCVLITTDAKLPERVWDFMESRIDDSPRRVIVEKALDNSGFLVVENVEEAMEVSNSLAPEHLSIQLQNPWSALDLVRSAGAVFVGKYSAVACGDYASGTNHILPTAGYPSIYSGLDVSHFMKRTSVQMISKKGLERIGDLVVTLADSEGRYEHARSVNIRREG
jgi:histidinol dehydrogenase